MPLVLTRPVVIVMHPLCCMLTPLLPCRHLRCSLSSRHAQSSAENLFFNGPRLHPLPAVRSWWRAPMDLPLHQKLLLATLNEPCIFDFSPRIFHKVFLLSGEALARSALSLSSRIARFPLLRLRACCLSVCHAVYVCVGECVWGRARCVFSGDRESAMCPQPASESRASWARCCRALPPVFRGPATPGPITTEKYQVEAGPGVAGPGKITKLRQ